MRNAIGWNSSRVLDSQTLRDNSRHLRRRFVSRDRKSPLDRLHLCNHHCHFALAVRHSEIQNYYQRSYACHLESHIHKINYV